MSESKKRKFATKGEGSMSSNSSLDTLRDVNNLYKRKLITEELSNKTILDLGYGCGGDMWKYLHAKIKLCFAIDRNPEFIEESKRRLLSVADIEQRKLFRIYPTPLDFCDSKACVDVVDSLNYTFDAVAAFFSIHTIFKSQQTLDAFCSIVGSAAPKIFVCTFMCGEAVLAWMKEAGSPTIESKGNFKIDASESQWSGAPKVALGLAIQMHLNAQTVPLHEEYLTSLTLLQAALSKYNLTLRESNLFTATHNKKLEPMEKRLVECNRYAIFERKEQDRND